MAGLKYHLSKWKWQIISIVIILGIWFYSSIEKVDYKYSCGVPPDRISDESKDIRLDAVFDAPYRWNEKVLNVYFIDTKDEELIKRTIATANRWSAFANIKFKFVEFSSTSHIRVSFREKGGYACIIGNLADSDRNRGLTTLWLQDIDTRKADEFTRVVLHEFGHALALQHELQSPNVSINWDSAAVYNFYDTAYGWKPKKVDSQIFTKIKTTEYTRFDPNSIMIYAVPAFLTKDCKSIEWPRGLSALDKSTIKKYYPFND